MDMTGERRIEAPRQTVWQALNDPAVLKASIPGCESLEKLSDTDMKATAAVKIGPIAARFSGAVHLTDIRSYLNEDTAFPDDRLFKEEPYKLSTAYRALSNIR